MTGWLEDVESESQEIGIDLDLTYRSYYICNMNVICSRYNDLSLDLSISATSPST